MSHILQAGMIVDERYRVVALIGQGGMGAVYEAIDLRLKSSVALKQMFLDAKLSPIQAEQIVHAFEREAKTLNRLRHPSLPHVSDYFVDTNGHFLVMHYIQGHDLAELLEQRLRSQGTPFTEQEILPWFINILIALEYLHSKSPPIIHRDIKPHNIKVTQEGHVFLLDFGISKGITSQTAVLPSAQSSIHAYTNAYAPLEQIQGKGTEPRSDLFSVGATMYHLLTGISLEEEPCRDALTRAQATLFNQTDPLTPPPGVSSAMSAVVMQALALNPEHRPASAKAMREALERQQAPYEIKTILNPNIADKTIVVASPRKAQQAQSTMLNPSQSTTAAPPRRPVWLIWGSVAAVLVLLLVVVTSKQTSFNSENNGTNVKTIASEVTPTVTQTATADVDIIATQSAAYTLTAIALNEPVMVFVGGSKEQPTISIMRGNGTTEQLTDGSTSIDYPQLSPDSTRIVYESNGYIFVMNIDGSNLQQLTDTSHDHHPVWSPDGTRIAFHTNRDSNWEIYTMNADGSDVHNISSDRKWNDVQPAWSPDGSKIAFASHRTDVADASNTTNSTEELNIYVMNSDGSEQTQLTADPSEDSFPCWSPDGTQIAFTAKRAQDGDKNHIYVISDFNTIGNEHLLTEQNGSYCSWSNDGIIAFTCGNNICIVDEHGEHLQTSFAIGEKPSWRMVSSIPK